MKNERIDNLITILEEIKNENDQQVSKKLEIDKCKRIIQRLESFSKDCDTCNRNLTEIEEQILQLRNKNLATDHITEFRQSIASIGTHLQKQHKLLPQGYYLSVYMSIGVSLGVVFGLTIFDNIGLGIPLGIATGVAIGSGLDADAKKKGKTL